MDNYGTTAGFAIYHTARGRDVSAYDDTTVLSKLLIGSEWLDGRYRAQFPGTKVGQRAQIREWPRVGGEDIYGYAISSETVPIEVENSTYEAAYREIQSPGSLSVDYKPNAYSSVAIDGAVSVKYQTYSYAAEVQVQLQIVDEILAPILSNDNGSDISPLSGGTARV